MTDVLNGNKVGFTEEFIFFKWKLKLQRKKSIFLINYYNSSVVRNEAFNNICPKIFLIYN